MKIAGLFIILLSGLWQSCNSQAANDLPQLIVEQSAATPINFDTTYKTIHVFVALCDNKYQGIVPVPASIGNGQDPKNNLYWGSAYGIRTWFKKSSDWKLISARKKDSIRLERLVFKHAVKNYYLIADAYDGKYIKQCTKDFLYSSAGHLKDTVNAGNVTIGAWGNASMVSYIGHDGLMDFSLSDKFENADEKKRDVIVLACYSKKYFMPHLREANVNPLVWTTGLMAPEAYTLHDAIKTYLKKESNEKVRTSAALAYAKYQRCSERAARNLLVTGW